MNRPSPSRLKKLLASALLTASASALSGCFLVAGGGIETGNTQVVDGGGIETGNAGVIAGRVKDASGEPVAGAEVGLTEVVLSHDGVAHSHVHTAITGADGSYSFTKVPFGRYTLFAPGRGETPLAGLMTRIRHNEGGGIETGNTQLADLLVRHTVRMQGRVLPAPGTRIEEVVACIPGTYHCTNPGPDSVYTFSEAPQGAYELVFMAGPAVHYVSLELQAARLGTIQMQDVALGDSGVGPRVPYRFYAMERLHRSLSVMPVEYPAGMEPAWYAGKDFSSVKYHLLNDGSGAEITSVAFFDLWSMRKELVGVDVAGGPDLAAPLAGFPVPIRLTRDNFDFDKARHDGSDLIVSDGNGLLLPHEIERWDAEAGKAVIWVRLDALAALRADRKLVLHWGRPESVPVAGGAGVFRAEDGFLGVWHLSDRSADNRVMDSRGKFDGFMTDSDRADWADSIRSGDAVVAGGHRFSNSGSYVQIDHRPGLEVSNAFTVSIWARSWNPEPGHDQVLAAKMENGKEEWRLRILHDGTLDLEFGTQEGWASGCVNTFGKVPKQDQWHLYTATFNRGQVKLYVDGVEMPSRVKQGGIPNAVQRHGAMIRIGADGNDNLQWNGSVDEFSYYNVAKSPAWIDMLYKTQRGW